MTEAQKFKIPLDSALEGHTSDNFVSVQKPTFLHNRQQLQGSNLATSLRFEHDGWAAGEQVYQFEFKDTIVPTTPEGYNVKLYPININRTQYQVMFINEETGRQEVWCYINKDNKAISGDMLTGSVLAGEINGKEYKIRVAYDSYEIIEGDNIAVELSTANGVTSVTVVDLDSLFTFNLESFMLGTDLTDTNSSILAKYTGFSDERHCWKSDDGLNEVYWQPGSSTVTVNGSGIPCTVDESRVSFEATLKTGQPINFNLMLDKFFPRIHDISTTLRSYNIDGGLTASEYVQNDVVLTKVEGNSLSNGSRVHLEGYAPIYRGFNLKSAVSFEDKLGVDLKEYVVASFDAYNTKVYASNQGEEVPCRLASVEQSCFNVVPGGWFNDTPFSVVIGPVHQGFSLPAIKKDDTPSNLKDFPFTVEVYPATETYPPYADDIIDTGSAVRVIEEYDREQRKSVQYISVSYAECLKGWFSVDVCMDDLLSFSTIESNIYTQIASALSDKIHVDRDDGVGRKLLDFSISSPMINTTGAFSCQLTASGEPFFNATGYPAIPGDVYAGSSGSVGKSGYNCSKTTANVAVDIKGTADVCQYITDAFASWGSIAGYTFPVYDKFREWAESVDITVAEPNINSSGTSVTQQISYATGDITGRINVNNIAESLQLAASPITIEGTPVAFGLSDSTLSSKFNLNVIPELLWNVSGSGALAVGETLKEYSAKDKAATFTKGDVEITLDLKNLSAVTSISTTTYPVLKKSGVYSCSFEQLVSSTSEFILMGVWKQKGFDSVSYANGRISCVIGGSPYSASVASLFNSKENKLLFKCTDVNASGNKQEQIASVNPLNEFQFLRQQWDTTEETENFWWINPTHILALTRTKLVLRRNTSELHDWYGEIWEDIAQCNRGGILTSEVTQYGVTSVSVDGVNALLWLLHADSSALCIDFYDPVESLENPVFSVAVPVIHINIGSPLNEDNTSLNTYSSVQASQLAAQAVFSSTRADAGHTLFGVHLDNNFNQWCIVINNSAAFSVVQGYGFVSVHGELTGGQIPDKWFDASRGFNDTVLSLDTLSSEATQIKDLEEIYTFEDRVVGNEAVQWYLTKQIESIVSHLAWNGSSFDVQRLPLNNNYDVLYKSNSFATRTYSNFVPRISDLIELFGFNGNSAEVQVINTLLNLIITLTGRIQVFTISPKINTWFEIQQSIGQYAYVHKNSANYKDIITEQLEKAAVSTKDTNINRTLAEMHLLNEFVFDKQRVLQDLTSEDTPWNTLALLIAFSVLGAHDTVSEPEVINKSISQTDTTELGKKFLSFFNANNEEMHSGLSLANSLAPHLSSGVVLSKCLEMFYSTSDSQQVNAGIGYVAHSFVAQCLAQSAYVKLSTLKQISYFYVIKELSTLQVEMEIKALQAAKHLLERGADQLAQQIPPSVTGSTSGNAPATVAAAIMNAAASVIEKELDLLALARDKFVSLITAFFGNGAQCLLTADQNESIFNIEGTHRYGTKSECFMYPCFGIPYRLTIPDESVQAVAEESSHHVHIPIINSTDFFGIDKPLVLHDETPDFVTDTQSKGIRINWDGEYVQYQIKCRGKSKSVSLPANMAAVIGTDSFLSKEAFQNENIDAGEPVFTVPPIQDYIIDSDWQLGQVCIGTNGVLWVSCKDTKLIDSAPSNIVVTSNFCGVASAYTAIEVKRGIVRKYLRPVAVTPNALLLNNSGLNSCYEKKAYHSCDGQGHRLVSWIGGTGNLQEHNTWEYNFLLNNRFKRGNKLDCNQFIGNFKGNPETALVGDYNDSVFTLVTQPAKQKGLQSGTASEDKDAWRYAIPVFTEPVNSLPAAVKTLSSYNLLVIDGLTSLTTEIRNTASTYKAPNSVDFTINKQLYRITRDYIHSVVNKDGFVITEPLVPTLGLAFMGSTPYEAILYSQATRQYYRYTGGTSLEKVDIIERFRNVLQGSYDFVNQEVVFQCLANFVRLDTDVAEDDDETDNCIVPRVKDSGMIGEVAPPIDTIYNTRSGVKVLSLPCGLVYQGPNRCIVNRFVYSDYMKDDILSNYGNWRRVPREKYHPFREYQVRYESVDVDIGGLLAVNGWTHNPFLLVTAPVGIDIETDCLYEWEITFAWTEVMDSLYPQDTYATVNIAAETMTSGGKVATRPTHVFLHKELFTRTGSFGYYSFRYQSKGGSGNRERLHIWSDQYIAISSLQCEVKVVSIKRSEKLTQQLTVQGYAEI